MAALPSTLQVEVLARASSAVGAGELLEALSDLEGLKNTIAAAQARIAVRLREQREVQRQHLLASQRGRGVGAEIGLARKESPHRGSKHLALGWVLVRELPHTLAAMEEGRCSEFAATIVARATACLSRDDRRSVDERLMADPATTDGWGERRLEAEADAIAYQLDPEAAVRRREHAVAGRHVSLRPVPGVEGAAMTRMSALLPLEAGVAAIASLGRAADSARSAGDPRSRGQVMADALIGRLMHASAGQLAPQVVEPDASAANEDVETVATTPRGPVTPIAVNVVVSDATLLSIDGPGGDQPGWIDGVPLPAETVRELIARASEHGMASLRRLYASPRGGQLVAMDSRSRLFPAGLARFLDRRDRTCRTPFCDAPIRHHDHLHAFLSDGATSAANGEGLCEACNYARQAQDFRPPPVPPPSPPTPLASAPRFTVDIEWHAA